jgi:acetyltransferase-like isoleucine patch superfamily enzyme
VNFQREKSIVGNMKMGRHSIINVGSNINHDCEIGSFVLVGPSVSIAGYAKIGDGCWISIGTKIINRISIGKGSLIAAGSVVTKDIPAGVLAAGVPAKPIRDVTESDWENVV